MIRLRLVLLLRFLSLLPLCKAQTPVTQGNIGTAVTAWVTNPATAATTYGPIGDWDTSAVSNLHTVFYLKPTFNSDISKWNVASVNRPSRPCPLTPNARPASA